MAVILQIAGPAVVVAVSGIELQQEVKIEDNHLCNQDSSVHFLELGFVYQSILILTNFAKIAVEFRVLSEYNFLRLLVLRHSNCSQSAA